ncbi:hypothetical protein H0H93_012883 [Arthromyces matolae]|nr:hypothetical protein H0H93_012883 [Arthromyces matolae]
MRETELLKRSNSLDMIYQQAAFELRLGRVSVKLLKPFTRTIERLRRELSRDLAFPRPRESTPAPMKDAITELYEPAIRLGGLILESVKMLETIVLECFEQSVLPTHAKSQGKALADCEVCLTSALLSVQTVLEDVCKGDDFGLRAIHDSTASPPEASELSSFIVSLLQMAHDVKLALRDAQVILSDYCQTPPRLWHPHFSWAWLGVAPSALLEDEGAISADSEIQDATITSTQEALRGIQEQHSPLAFETNSVLSGNLFLRQCVFRVAWNSRRMLSARVLLSRIYTALKRSPHIQHALKNAAGVSILSIPAFLPPSYNGTIYGYGGCLSILADMP